MGNCIKTNRRSNSSTNDVGVSATTGSRSQPTDTPRQDLSQESRDAVFNPSLSSFTSEKTLQAVGSQLKSLQDRAEEDHTQRISSLQQVLLQQGESLPSRLQGLSSSVSVDNTSVQGSQLTRASANTSIPIPPPRYRVLNNPDQHLRRHCFPDSVVTKENIRIPQAQGLLIGPINPSPKIFGQVSAEGTLTYHVNINEETNLLSGQVNKSNEHGLSGHELIQSLVDEIGQSKIARIQVLLVNAPGIDSDYQSFKHYRHNENLSPVEAAANTHAGRYALRSGYRDVCVIHDEVSKGIRIEFAWPGMTEYPDDTSLGEIQVRQTNFDTILAGEAETPPWLDEPRNDDDSEDGLFF